MVNTQAGVDLLSHTLPEGRRSFGVNARAAMALTRISGVDQGRQQYRRLLNVQKSFSAFFVDDALIHSIRTPTTIQLSRTVIQGIELMEKKQIRAVEGSGKLVGLLHRHPAIQAVSGMDQ